MTTQTVLLRVLVAFGLTFLIGFERALRGSAAGDRTFSLIGTGSAVIGVLATHNAANALAGVVTGIGFLGAGLLFRPHHDTLRGVTSAATIFTTAAIGAAAGFGQLALATVATALALISLELQHCPGLRLLDAHRWAGRVTPDRVGSEQAERGSAPSGGGGSARSTSGGGPDAHP